MFFAIKDLVVKTPGSGVLEGVTRKTAIELASASGYQVVQDDLTPEFARNADELFATSTAGGIMPITTIDGQKVGNGAIGPITQKLQEAYWALHENPEYAAEIKY